MKTSFVGYQKHCISLENNPGHSELMNSELGSDTVLVPCPTWEHNPCSLELIGLSIKGVCIKRVQIAWLKEQNEESGLEQYKFLKIEIHIYKIPVAPIPAPI